MRILTNGFIHGKRSEKKLENKQSPSPKQSSTKDSVQLSSGKPSLSISRGLKRALLAASLITALSGPALAQTAPGTAPLIQESAKIEMVQQQDTTKQNSDFSVRLNFVNDNGPGFMHRALGREGDLQPGTQNFGDDDGWTSELSIQTVKRNGQTETVAGARLMMLTETGSWNRNAPGSTYQGLRTDIGEVVVQKNFTQQLGETTSFTYGVGGGVQTIGNLGGESIQRTWHESGPFGGRTGTALQGQYTSDGFRVMPMVTGGAKLTESVNKNIDFNLVAQANVPIGQGIGQTSVMGSVSGEFGPVSLELGGKVNAGWSMADEASFHDIGGVHTGAFGKLEVDAKYGSIYTQVETGGFRGEPVLTVGLRIGLGGAPKINPFQ